MKIYCLSGLGVDERAFKNIIPKGIELVHIPWIAPHKKESLNSYALRLFNSIPLETNYSLIGVSFGGMVALEFSKLRRPKNLFLISTIPSKSYLRPSFKFGAAFSLHKLLPTFLLKKTNLFTYYLFGIRSKEDKQLIKEILKETDGHFLKWAIHAIVNWKNKENINGTVIHGAKDRLLPRTKDVHHSIENAGHFMIVTKGSTITKIIEAEIR